MDVSRLWALDTTTLCVSAFVCALGVLWMYVMLSRPSASQNYERLEELLSGEQKKSTGKAKKDAKKGKGKIKTTEGSPRPIQSPQKKKSSSPEVVTAGSDARRKDRGGQTEGMSGKSSAPKKEAKTTRDEAGEERKQEFQLVIKASKGKRDNPAVSPDNDPLPVSKAGKKEDPVVSKTTGTKGSTPVINVTKEDAPVVSKTTTAQGDTPVVSMTTPAKGDTPVVSMTTPAKGDNYKTKGDTSVVSNASKGKQKETAVSKETSDDVDVSDISKTEKTVKKKVPGEEEEGESEKREGEDGGRKEEEGEWHTQLSRQQLRALKQKEKEKVDSQKKTAIIEEKQKEGGGRNVAQRSPRARGQGGEGRGEGGGGGKGEVGRRREGAAGRARKGGREGEPKRWKIPDKEDSATIATTTTTTGEEGVVSLPEAPPTTTAPSVDGQAGSPVAQSPVARSNLTDLEKAMREAASASSDDITITSSKPTAGTTTSSDGSVTQETGTEVLSQVKQRDARRDDSESPTEQAGPVGGGAEGEAIVVSGAASPDEEEWVVLEQPT